MRHHGFLITALAMAGCSGGSGDATGLVGYHSALTGAACEPDDATYVPMDDEQRGNHGAASEVEKVEGLESNPLGIPGDNEDDSHSGMTDCLGDGNSGHGDDWKHGCVPQGCDADACCRDDWEDDDGGDAGDDGDETPEDPGSDAGSDDGSDDGSTGDGGSEGEDPVDQDPPSGDAGGDAGSGSGDSGSGGTDGGGSDAPIDCSHLDDACGTGVPNGSGGCTYQISLECISA